MKMAKLVLIALLITALGLAVVFIWKSVNGPQNVAEGKTIRQQFEHIEVQTDNAKIEILPADSQNTRVELSAKKSIYRLSTDVAGNTLNLKVEKRYWFIPFTSVSSTLNVYVPDKEYRSVDLISDNGKINLDGLRGASINARTDNGGIEFNNTTAKKIETATDNGSTYLNGIRAESVSVKSSNGKVRLENVDGDLSLKTNNGSITLLTNHLDRTVDMESDNGNIRIETEREPTNATIEATVDNGIINVLGDRSGKSVFGNGKHRIILESDNGNIIVEKK